MSMTPKQRARDEALDKRHVALIRSGALDPIEEIVAIQTFQEIADDDTKGLDDLHDAMEAHLAKFEASMN